jgi:hypothetical protein
MGIRRFGRCQRNRARHSNQRSPKPARPDTPKRTACNTSPKGDRALAVCAARPCEPAHGGARNGAMCVMGSTRASNNINVHVRTRVCVQAASRQRHVRRGLVRRASRRTRLAHDRPSGLVSHSVRLRQYGALISWRFGTWAGAHRADSIAANDAVGIARTSEHQSQPEGRSCTSRVRSESSSQPTAEPETGRCVWRYIRVRPMHAKYKRRGVFNPRSHTTPPHAHRCRIIPRSPVLSLLLGKSSQDDRFWHQRRSHAIGQ